jgi:hypothetical protein
MNHDEVERQVERITTLGSWTEPAANELAVALAKLTDPWVLREAVDELVATWDTGFRPPIARVLALYRAKFEQRVLREPQPRPLENLVVVPPERGYDIAMQSYVADCKERGIPVDVDKFHRVMGALVGDRSARFLRPETKGPGRPSRR